LLHWPYIQNKHHHRLVIRFFVYTFQVTTIMDKRVQETFNNLHKGVVLVICRAANENDRSVSTGSGFIIGKTERGYLVMTCYHVIKNHPKLSVRIPSDDKDTKEYAAQVVKVALEENEMELFHKQVDLVVIEVYGLTRECQVLEFCDPGAVEDVAPETDVFILGYINRPTRKGSPSTLNLKPAVSPGSIW
jgi:hypothetical protein